VLHLLLIAPVMLCHVQFHDRAQVHPFAAVSGTRAGHPVPEDGRLHIGQACFGVIEVDDDEYLGRTFNRVMGNAARGLLERIASAKLAMR
jgi:hypothetical protein